MPERALAALHGDRKLERLNRLGQQDGPWLANQKMYVFGHDYNPGNDELIRFRIVSRERSCLAQHWNLGIDVVHNN